MDVSSQKFLALVTQPNHVDKLVAEKVTQMFVKSYCKEYYKKNQSWPAVTIRGPISSSLRSSIEHSVWKEMGPHGWEESEFESISIRQNENFDYFVDQSDLLTDKAICQELSI